MSRFYTDEDIPSLLIRLLWASNLQHNVVTTRDLNRQGDNDVAQLLTATQQQRIMLTHNARDFLLLHTAWHRWSQLWNVSPQPKHAGIVAIPQQRDYPFPDMVDELERLISGSRLIANEMYRWHRNPDGWTWERWRVDRNQWEPRP